MIPLVPADPAGWKTPPFEAVEKDGSLYGRGTADIKGMCAAQMAVLAFLKRTAAPLARDVIFFAEADEESGASARHIDSLLRDRPELVDAEFAINEGGNSLWKDGKIEEIRVEAAEKEYMDLTLTARGKPGHSSVPTEDNAVARLAGAAARLAAHRFPVALNAVTRGFLEAQAKTAEPAVAGAVAAAPGVRVIPYMAAWTTDSQDIRARGTIVYGIDPPMTLEDLKHVHGEDERLPLAGLDWYAGYLRDIVVRTAGK